MIIEHQETVEILKWFEEISKIPRCSKREEHIGQWLVEWADRHGFHARKDIVGNVLIHVPASGGYENAPTVVIQGHLDMVCEKTEDSDHDFEKDPIRFVYKGQWISADKTSLGADNGIGIAIGMAAALDNTLKHPPLELLFTVDEETGLTGANAMSPGFIEGRRLLNIDSEKEGVFTIGSAGGEMSTHTLPLAFDNAHHSDINMLPVTIEAGGMDGGHSASINQEKANALKVLARVLHRIQNVAEIRLANLQGGGADNAIPRIANAVIFIDKAYIEKAEMSVIEIEKTLQSEYKHTDPGLKITFSQGSKETYVNAVTAKDTEKVISLFMAIPHGIYAMSTEIEHFVETSNNFANARIEDQYLKIITSQRSPVVSKLDDISCHIASVVKLAGGTSEHSDRYPGWSPNLDSPLLKKSVDVYERLFGRKPVVETTHGGLECGIFSEKFHGIEMLSFGPTILFPHSPGEKIDISTIEHVWEFLKTLLEELN